MKRRMNVPLRVAAVTASAALVTMSVGAPALAAEGDVQVVNTETVKVYTDATGAVDSMRIYEQISLTGDGEVDLRNPIATDGLRNLDGFGGYSVEDGEQVASVSVDGERRLRSVSDYDGELPLDVQVRYFLDGEPIEPGDVVGEDGELEVRYTVKNVTGAPQEVTIDDGSGGTVTRTVEVPIPMVGSLTVTTPPNFTDFRSDQANLAGDGKGGTKLSFTMTLFPPIGSDTAEFGYTANISDGVIPRAAITALPVNPLESPSFASAGESYKGGADTGTELAAGASEIDANLLKLRDGAGELLAGLIQLRDGAQELQAGLAGEAAPGAAQLAAGSTELAGGIGQLDAGAGQLSAGASELSAGAGRLGAGINLVDDGAQQLAAGGRELSAGTSQLAAGTRRLSAGTRQLAGGTGDALAGSQALAAGAGQLSAGVGELGTGATQLDGGAAQLAAGQRALADGLEQLYMAVDLLPASVDKELQANADYQKLLGTLSAIIAGIGTPGDATQNTVLGGLNLLKWGLRNPSYTIATCDRTPELPTDADYNPADDCGAADGVQIASIGLANAVTSINTALAPAAKATYAYVAGTINAIPPATEDPCPSPASAADLPPISALLTPNDTCRYAAVAAYGYASPAIQGTDFANGGLALQLGGASASLQRIYEGLDTRGIGGIEALKKALYNSPCDPTQTDKTATNYCGISQALSLVQAGIPQLVSAVVNKIEFQLITALGQPTENCAPEETLRCAAEALADGGSELSQGMDALLAGVAKLNEGGAALSVGAGDLAAGLGLIDAGAQELNTGAGELRAGASELNAGAGRLAAGAGELAGGTGQLADGAPALVDGAGRLSAGAGELAAGTGKAADGANQIADGANQLASGLGDAADGSGRLADGLATAADGAPALEDGAQRLSDEGTSKLVEAGESTAQNYGEMYATLEAGAERAQTEKMVFGAPEDAMGLAAYSFEIMGEDGEGSRNVARGLGGLAVLAAGAAAFGLRRKLI